VVLLLHSIVASEDLILVTDMFDKVISDSTAGTIITILLVAVLPLPSTKVAAIVWSPLESEAKLYIALYGEEVRVAIVLPSILILILLTCVAELTETTISDWPDIVEPPAGAEIVMLGSIAERSQTSVGGSRE